MLGVSLMRLHLRGQPGWQLIWTSAGEGSSLKLMYGLLAGVTSLWVIGLRASVPSWRCLEAALNFHPWGLSDVAICFIRGSKTVCQQDRGHSLCTLFMEVTSHHICHILLVTNKSQVLLSYTRRVLHEGITRKKGNLPVTTKCWLK